MIDRAIRMARKLRAEAMELRREADRLRIVAEQLERYEMPTREDWDSVRAMARQYSTLIAIGHATGKIPDDSCPQCSEPLFEHTYEALDQCNKRFIKEVSGP